MLVDFSGSKAISTLPRKNRTHLAQVDFPIDIKVKGGLPAGVAESIHSGRLTLL